MRKDWVLFHLREGLEELTRAIVAIETMQDYDDGEFAVAMAHMYNHLNTAWNSRNTDPERTANCTEDDFYEWRAYPSDISMT